MNVQCTQEKLKKALSAVERVTGKNTTLPILENILLQTKDGLLYVTATNLEIGVSTSLGVKIEQEGSIVVPSGIFSQFIGALPPSSVITFETKGTEISIQSDRHNAKIQGFDSEEFPLIPKPKKNTQSFTVKGDALRQALVKNSISVSPQDVRVEFTGVYCRIVGEEMVFASTDSFRLTETKIAFEKKVDFEGDGGYILPGSTVSEILRLLGENIDRVQMIFEDEQVFIMMDDVVYLVSRLISGSFPAYEQIIPEKFETEVFVNSEDLEQAVKLSGIFSDRVSGEIFFDLNPDGNEIILKTKNGQSGENTSVISAEIKGKKLSIVFNPRYILDALHILPLEKIGIFLNLESSPAVFRACDKKNVPQKAYQYVLMPIKK